MKDVNEKIKESLTTSLTRVEDNMPDNVWLLLAQFNEHQKNDAPPHLKRCGL